MDRGAGPTIVQTAQKLDLQQGRLYLAAGVTCSPDSLVAPLPHSNLAGKM